MPRPSLSSFPHSDHIGPVATILQPGGSEPTAATLGESLPLLRQAADKLKRFRVEGHDDVRFMLKLLLAIDQRNCDHLERVWNSLSDPLCDGGRMALGLQYSESLAQASLQVFQAIEAGEEVIDASLIDFLVRAMRAQAEHARWQWIQYRSPAASTWRAMADIYRFIQRRLPLWAEEIEQFEAQVAALEIEYVQALLFRAVPAFGLTEAEIRLWARIIRTTPLKDLGLRPLPCPGAAMAVDIGSGEIHGRGHDVPAGPEIRYLPLQVAGKILAAFAQGAPLATEEGRPDPAAIELARRLLERNWGPRAGVRSEPRRALVRSGEVVVGHFSIISTLRSQGRGTGSPGGHFVRCAVLNISHSGCCISLPDGIGTRLRVNSLIYANCGDGGPSRIGVTQWIRHANGKRNEAGIRFLEGSPTIVPVASRSPWPSGLNVENLIILCHGDYQDCEEVQILLKPGHYDPARRCTAAYSSLGLEPVAQVGSGRDYELASFRVVATDRDTRAPQPGAALPRLAG